MRTFRYAVCLAALLSVLWVAHIAWAMPIATTISATVIHGWRYSGTTATLRVYANQDFTSSTGEIIKAGNAAQGSGFYRSYECVVSGTDLTIPAITDLPTTSDSPDSPNATYTSVFYDYRGTKRDTWLVFSLKHTYASPQAWSNIRSYNTPIQPQPRPSSPTFDQVALMVANGPRSGVATSVTPGSTSNPCTPGDVFFGVDSHYYVCPEANNPSQLLDASTPINAANLINTPGLVGFVTPDTYGAIHDGSSHPLSSVYGSLGAAQAAYSGAYSFVTSLSQEIDYAAVKAASNAALGADSVEHGAANAKLNHPIFLPAGTYILGNNTWTIRNASGIHIYGAGRTATKLQSNNTVFATDGLWYSQIQGIEFDTLTNSGIAAFDIDGNVPGHPYATRGVQGNTFKDLLFDGGGSTYATALCRLGQGGGQCSENTWDNDHWINASEAAYYQIGANALHNLVKGGDSQGYQKDGFLIVGGSIMILVHAFESTYQYTQVANGGFDIHTGEFGVNERIVVIGCRTESLQFFKGSGTQPPILIGNTQTSSAVTVWQAAANYHVIGTEMLKQVLVNGSTVWKLFSLTTTGISGLVEPVWPPSGTITDGTAVWTQRTFYTVDTSSISGDQQPNYAAINNGFLVQHFAGYSDPFASTGATITSSFTIARENLSHIQVLFPVDATAANVTITSPIVPANQVFILKKVDASSHTVTLAGTGGALVDGGASVSIPGGSQGWLAVQFSVDSGANNFNIIGSSDAKTLNGGTFSSPLPIGNVTPAAITGTTITANTSLVINGGSALTTTNRTGTGNLVLATNPTITPASVTITSGPALVEGRLSAVSGVDMNTATPTILYTCPAARTCVITRVVVRNASTSLTTASYSFGWTSAAYSDVIANATHTELTGAPLYTILTAKTGATIGNSTDTFRVLMNTLQGGAATTTIDVYGMTF